MIRDCRDVARSAAKKFSDDAAYRNLSPIVDRNAAPTFTSEIVSEDTRRIVRRFLSKESDPQEEQAGAPE